MAEEEAVISGASPTLSERKRKLDVSEVDALDSTEITSQDNGNVSVEKSISETPLETNQTKDGSVSYDEFDGEKKIDEVFNTEKEDLPESKRQKIEDDLGDLKPSMFSTSGSKADGFECKPMEHEKDAETTAGGAVDMFTAQAALHEVLPEGGEGVPNSTSIHHTAFDDQIQLEAEKSSWEDEDQIGSEPMPQWIEIPNDKVGVLIGKGGETIRYLQQNSGTKIQITKDAAVDPQSKTRSVEIVGTLSSIKKAEQLINAVIAEADAGGSPSLVARGLHSYNVSGGEKETEMRIPDDKVGLLIGKGGDTIKTLQTRSCARIQLIPQNFSESNGSKERTVRVTGNREQVEMAVGMIKDVLNQGSRSFTTGFNQQQHYRGGSDRMGSGKWGSRGSMSSQQTRHDYKQRGSYPPYGSQHTSSHGYYPPPQRAPSRTFSSGWDQRPPSGMQGSFQSSGGHDGYGGQGGNATDSAMFGPGSGAPGYPSGPGPTAMGSQPPMTSYGQPMGPNYAQNYGQSSYPQQANSQQNYGHGYDDSKYNAGDSAAQNPYAHGSSQSAYAQPASQPGYAAQQQYSKQPYPYSGQGQVPQSYAPSGGNQPGDLPYTGQTPAAQSYTQQVPTQQYPYSSGSMQQQYPSYGSTGVSMYNQGQSSVPNAGFSQPSGPAQAYAQPPVQQSTAYMQAPATGYAPPLYQSAQGYAEPQTGNAGSYGYQNPTDGSNYGTPAAVQPSYTQQAPAPVMQVPNPAMQSYVQQVPGQSLASPGVQQGYVQPAPAQGGYVQQPMAQPVYTQQAQVTPGLDQPMMQPAAYAQVPSQPATAVATLSPQPALQYDASQVYATPH